MPRPIYSEIHLHITWHTKDNASVITGSIETQLHSFLRNRVLQSPGVLLHAIGGTDDHLHLAVSAPPTLLVSDWVGELKGASAYYINHRVANRKLLAWQTGYGVVSFGTLAVPWVVRYIENQRRHHAAGTTSGRLERITSDTSDAEKPVKTG
jgi:putative transposase